MLDLLLRLRKDGKQLNHYLSDNLRHQRAQRDLGIDLEAFEEAPDTFEELEESVIARTDPFGRLIWSDIRGTQPGDRNDDTHGEEDINADENEFSGLERNLFTVEKELKIRRSWRPESHGIHQGCLAKNVREGVNELHNRIEAIDELPILVSILLELIPILFE
jgi:hypothetical protein